MRLRRFAGWSALLLASGLGLAIWVMLVVFATRPGFKAVVDLSPQRRFTLTEDSAELLKAVRAADKSVELHTVYEPLGLHEQPTERERHVYTLRRSIQDLTTDLLRQYHALGGDRVLVFHHDIRSEIREVRELTRALDRRIQNFVLVKVGERSKVLSVDFDLAEIDMGQAAATPLPGQTRDPKPLLRDFKGEEAISSAIKSLLVEGTPKCYVLEGYGEANIRDASAFSYSSLMLALEREGFQIARLNLAEKRTVPADAACLALIEPRQEMDDAHAEAIVAYLRRGGRLFLNPVYVPTPESWNPTLENLGQRLGFGLGRDLVCNLVADPQHPDSPGTHGSFQCQNLEITGLNPVHELTRVLYRVGRFPTVKMAREIRKSAEPPADVAVDLSLLRTSQYSWLEERTVAGEGGERQVDWYAPAGNDVMASRCVGAVIDVVATEGERPGHVVIVSGYAFNNAAFPTANGDLALNIFQWMAERKALVGVRGTRYQPRELKLVGQQVDRVFWLLVLGVPGALLLSGILVLWRRSRI
ncbi:MAG: Gldg family protein [Planctomycetota bacterium]